MKKEHKGGEEARARMYNACTPAYACCRLLDDKKQLHDNVTSCTSLLPCSQSSNIVLSYTELVISRKIHKICTNI